MTIQNIIDRCKCGVYLTVNEHRDVYETVKEKIQEINERNSEPEINETLAKRLIAANCIYELQFYPDTPVGFYIVYGATLDEVIEKAEKCLT